MQQIATLIRLSKFQLDDKKRRLRGLRELIDDLQQSLQCLEQEFAEEQNLASIDAKTFTAYRESIEQRKAKLVASLREIESEIEAVNDEIVESFQELKRYEITLKNNEKRSRKKRGKKQQAALDEFGIQTQYRMSG